VQAGRDWRKQSFNLPLADQICRSYIIGGGNDGAAQYMQAQMNLKAGAMPVWYW